MSKEALLAQLAANPNLPTPPTVALQVLDRASRPHCTLGEIGRIISHDPALCGRLLKMVNSALFGLSRAVTSIDRALNLLGLKRVRSLVLSLSLPTLQVRSKSNPRIRDYWKASVAGAIVTRELAQNLRLPDPDSDMVAGLLADLGMLILQEVYPDQYLQVMAYPPEVLATDQCRLEERILGVHHAEVAAHLLRRWRLPEEMTEPILHHHRPEEAPAAHRDRAWLLSFGGRIGQLQLTVAQSVLLGEIVAIARDRYGMDDQRFRAFLEPLTRRIEEFASLLQVDIGTCREYPTLFASATENLTRLAVETSLDNFRVQEEQQHTRQQLRKAEETLHETEEKLRQAMKLEAIGRLAGGVAHDFNNLLTVINGCSELALAQLPTGSNVRALVEEVKKAGERAADLTRQLLAFSRKQILVPEVIDLNQAIEGMRKMLGRLIGEDIELRTVLAPDLIPVRVDPTQIDQVILNLTLNARDAMPQGGKLTLETSEVDLSKEYVRPYPDLQPGRYVLLAVSDDGCGMSAETISKVFEPFFTTKGNHGTGLGLATVHGIVKQSGGHIAVYSEVGLGTTFKVYLPALSEAVAAPRESAPEEGLEGTETILLTEDEEGVRLTARRMLEGYGYTVLEAADGWQALAIADAHPGPIQLLVTDTIMPQMGGCELAQRLSRTRPDLKVLYISGYADEAIIRHGVLGSGLPFLQKPFSPQALARKIREVLRSHRDI